MHYDLMPTSTWSHCFVGIEANSGTEVSIEVIRYGMRFRNVLVTFLPRRKKRNNSIFVYLTAVFLLSFLHLSKHCVPANSLDWGVKSLVSIYRQNGRGRLKANLHVVFRKWHSF